MHIIEKSISKTPHLFVGTAQVYVIMSRIVVCRPRPSTRSFYETAISVEAGMDRVPCGDNVVPFVDLHISDLDIPDHPILWKVDL